MDFGHYTNEGATMAADLVNTVGSNSGTEFMPDVKALRDFLDEHEMDVPSELSEEDLEEVRSLRTLLKGVFLEDDEALKVERLNMMLEDSGASPRISNHDGHPWHFHYVPTDASVARRMTAVAAMGLAAVICEYGADRLGHCASENCDDAFVDISRNHSKRYCSNSCSSRVNVAAYRARRKTAESK